jgi:hypothetical protein
VVPISDLTDVTITGTPADNELLAYDTATSEWINQTADEAGIVQVYSQTTEPTGKVGDVWIDTSSEVNSWSSFMPYSMAAGQVSLTGVGTSAISETFTFPAGRFSVTPIVTATCTTNSFLNVAFTSVSSTSATVQIRHIDGSTFISTHTVDWQAIQMTPTNGEG